MLVMCPYCKTVHDIGDPPFFCSYSCGVCNAVSALWFLPPSIHFLVLEGFLSQGPSQPVFDPPPLHPGTLTTPIVQNTITLKRPRDSDSKPPPKKRKQAPKRKESVQGGSTSAPEGVAAFVRTPAPLACFMYDLLRGPRDVKNFYLMPCVGDGGIPLAWLENEHEIAGGVFCELFPNSLHTLEQQFISHGWALTIECDEMEWKERFDTGIEVGTHLDELQGVKKKRGGLNKRKAENKTPEVRSEIEELTSEIAVYRDDSNQPQRERRIAKPLYRGCLRKGRACIFLFQGSSTLLFDPASTAYKILINKVEAFVKPRGLHIVAAENLPWGRASFLGETADEATLAILPRVLALTTPGRRSAFVIDRSDLVANTNVGVPRRITALWAYGSIVRLFPLPGETFPGHSMPMACLFVFRRFEEKEKQLYDAIVALLNLDQPRSQSNQRRREREAEIRYYCGLLAAEDMAWSRVQKRVSTLDGDVVLSFGDSIMDYQNRVLSDSEHMIYHAGRTQNPKSADKYLVQVSGGMIQQLDNQIAEESASSLGELAIDMMYHAYRAAALGTTESSRYITAETFAHSGAVERIQQCQTRLLDVLYAITHRDEHGNIQYEVQEKRSKYVHGGDCVAAHGEIVRLIRLVAMIHRVVVPSFVLEHLVRLQHQFAHNAKGLAAALAQTYKAATLDRELLKRWCCAEDAGEFTGEITVPQVVSREHFPDLPLDRIYDPVPDQVRRLVRLLLLEFDQPTPPQTPFPFQLVQAPCSQFQIPCGQQACSPMAVLALSSLLNQSGAIDIPQVLVEGAALYARLMASAEEQSELMKALALSLQTHSVLSRSTEELGGSKALATEDTEDLNLSHWAPSTVAEWVSNLTIDKVTSVDVSAILTSLADFLRLIGDRGATLVFGGYTIAVARVGEFLYLFDSHGYSQVTPNAFCARFPLTGLNDLCNVVGKMVNARATESHVGVTMFRRAT